MSIPLDRITPIPNTSPLMGTLNLRGRVIWVADLGQFFGKQTALNIERAEIPVTLKIKTRWWGLADKIVGMEWLDVEKCRC